MTYTYKLSPKSGYQIENELDEQSVIKYDKDNPSNEIIIPLTEGNTDYQEYLAWLEEGNTPEPADE